MNTPSLTDSMNDRKQKVIFFSNEFPNEDIRSLFRRLHIHSKDRRFRLLATFLDEVKFAMKDEISKIPQDLQELIPPFDSILTLVDNRDLREGRVKAAVEAALLMTLEIGMLIGHYEGQNLEYDILTTETVAAGVSLGLLAAAAVCLSSSITELANIGGESVKVAFRLGAHVDGFSRSLEFRGPSSNTESWAYVVTGLAAEEIQKEIDHYNTDTKNAELTKIFISAADRNSVNVTGPPARLKAVFRHSQILRYCKYFPLPVYEGLCHASHLFSTEDISSVVSSSNSKIGQHQRVLVPLLSSATGKQFKAKYANELYFEVATELMTSAVFLDDLTEGIQGYIMRPEISECQISFFQTSMASNRLFATIQAKLPQVAFAWQSMLDWSAQQFEPRLPRSPKESKLAIVGMSCRMPGGADDNELFWKLMVDGRDTCTTVPLDRFDLRTHFDPTGEIGNSTQVPWGNFIDQPGLFDPGFFNMSPREAEQTDPMQRLALITAYEALEMSGYSPNRTPSTNVKRVGTYYGQASDDWRELNGSQNLATYTVTGGVRAFTNGRINYFFGFEGPSFNIDTACSSSAAAVNSACSALWSGEADTVLAGGVSVITDPDNYCALGLAHFLSKTGQCKVWDKGADGYCRSDGVASVVIKRLEDAEADNDNILGVILAGATNHSAEAISITHPHVGAQKRNYTQVIQNAGINPLDVSYVELHGTGTQAGDAVESESVLDIFAPLMPRRRSDQKLLMGSVKSNIGHGEAAAGIASLVKLLLMYQKNHIPPHIGIKTEMNPTIPQNMAERNAALNLENTPWPKVIGKKRISLLNSFGAHGGNTTFLLEDAPEKSKVGVDPRTTHTIAISAKSKNSLRGNIEAMLAYLERHPETDLGDLGYTTCARRMHHNTRLASAVSSIPQLQTFLQSSLEEVNNIRPIPMEFPDVVFAFTGQGAFYEGMSAELFQHIPYYRSQILQLDHIVRTLGFPSIVPSIDGSREVNASALVSQLTIVVVEIALTRFWASMGIHPSAVIGHSLGEYSAMVAAGILSATDVLYLVGKRAQLMMKTCESGSHIMLACRASVEDVQKVCTNGEAYEISCINGHADTVISGARTDIGIITKTLKDAGIKCAPLELPFAFHTAQMDIVLNDFEDIAKHVTFKEPSLPYLSPLLSNCVFDSKTINGKYLRRATRESVNFIGALEAAMELGTVDERTIWIDIGPHPIAGGFVGKYIPDAKVLTSLRKDHSSFATISSTLTSLYCEGLAVRWNEYYRPFERAHDLLVLEKYKWNEKNYWIQYIGTWTLDKALLKDNLNKKAAPSALMPSASSLRTANIHQVTFEEIKGSKGRLIALTDMTHPDFLHLMNGHKMNNYAVGPTAVWMDMAMSVGEHMYKKMLPKVKEVPMRLTDTECHAPQVAQITKDKPQLVQVEAALDMDTESMKFDFYNVSDSGERAAENYASASLTFEDPATWKTEWNKVQHLVNSRVEALSQMAITGQANRMSKNMIYRLFESCVQYSEEWKGMDTVVLNELEAYCDITLQPGKYEDSNSPAPWIDSVCHIAGWICNGGDVCNTKDFFYVTSHMGSWRMAKPMKAGEKYCSYVRMFPGHENNHWVGDVYMLQDGIVVGMVEQIAFHGLPRKLLDFFMSPPEVKAKSATPAAPRKAAAMPAIAPVSAAVNTPSTVEIKETPKQASEVQQAPAAAQPSGTGQLPPLVVDCLKLIAGESGMELSELTDDKLFVEIGCDSLMSLVLSEKFKKELRLDVKSSLFLECPTVGELKGWLEQYT